MVKMINEVIEIHCHKGISNSRIFKLLKGTVSCSGVNKTVKRFRETGSCLLKVRSTTERPMRMKKLIKNIVENLRENLGRSTRKLAQEALVNHSTMQRLLKNNHQVKPYKATKRQLFSHATKKFERANVLLNMLLNGTQTQVLWTDKKLFTI